MVPEERFPFPAAWDRETEERPLNPHTVPEPEGKSSSPVYIKGYLDTNTIPPGAEGGWAGSVILEAYVPAVG